MRKIENHCVGCEVCHGCGRNRVEVYYCDKCKDVIQDEVYDDGEQELCMHCLLEKYEKELF